LYGANLSGVDVLGVRTIGTEGHTFHPLDSGGENSEGGGKEWYWTSEETARVKVWKGERRGVLYWAGMELWDPLAAWKGHEFQEIPIICVSGEDRENERGVLGLNGLSCQDPR